MTDLIDASMQRMYAYRHALRYTTKWSIEMDDPNWNLDTVVIDVQGELSCTDKRYPHSTIAENGTVRELWAAAEEHYQKAFKDYGEVDHTFLERARRGPNGTVEFFFGS